MMVGRQARTHAGGTGAGNAERSAAVASQQPELHRSELVCLHRTMATASPPPPVIPFTGIPRLPKKLPHRNWFIAAAVVSLPSYLYYDDRKQAAQLKQAFIDRVSHLADQPLPEGAVGNVRKVTVYAGRWPGEEDGKAAAWFKRYVKVRIFTLLSSRGDLWLTRWSLPFSPTWSRPPSTTPFQISQTTLPWSSTSPQRLTTSVWRP